jgi:hypothetical protein
MDDGIGPLDQLGKAIGPIERALNPFDARARQLRATRQRAYVMAPFRCNTQHMAADKAGGAGDGEQAHSITR